MTEPCIQESRVCTLESSLERISDNLVELKDTAKETYRVLADISKQGAEISALVTRTDKLERSLDQLIERMRTTDETLVTHSAFITEHIKAETRRTSLGSSVMSGLIVAAVVAAVTFAFWMMDRHEYTQRSGNAATTVTGEKL